MKRCAVPKIFLVAMCILTVFSILPGCGGIFGGGRWDKPVTVSSTVPANAATAVAIGNKLTVTFSGAMDPATLTTATFTVTQGATAVSGTVACSGVTATFTPASNLAAGLLYTATITRGAKSLEGQALASNYVWSFTTGAAIDTTPPTVSSIVPLDLATNVATNSSVTATFSEAMDPLTITTTTFTLKQATTPVSGAVTYSGVTAVFTPASNLVANTVYTATITAGAKDLGSNPLAVDKVWSFTTGASADTTPPRIVSTNPNALATNVTINSAVTATFSEAMTPLTINTTTFTVKASGPPLGPIVVGTVAYNSLSNSAAFTPQNALTPDTDYTVTVTNGAKDLAGNALVVPAVAGLPTPNPWTFRTAAAIIPPVTPLAINLGRAASFGIASRAGLTTTGVTVVNGDIALSPNATCSDATGLAGASQTCLSKTYSSPTGMTVNGSIFWAGDTFDSGVTANAVTTDLTTAWNEGMGKVNTQPAIAAGELGGKTFIPGVYENANLTLSAGGVATLDAQNDPNAIFIFKTTLGGDFVDSGTLLLPSRIVLLNQAQARNVWFVIGRDATIGSGTTWHGNILANRTATVLNGSTVNGRVLAGAGGAGAITLTGAAAPSVTTITVP